MATINHSKLSLESFHRGSTVETHRANFPPHMPPSARVRQFARSRFDLLLALIGSLSLAAVVAMTSWIAVDRGEMLTRNTVRLALAWYLAALLLMTPKRSNDLIVASRLDRIARWCWSWGVICFLVHLGMAFHYYDHWSHAEAYERTRQASGVGEGLYVSYLFTVAWVVDAVYWWAAPQARATRRSWIDRMLHLLMLAIVFNAMVVFEAGLIRWAGLAMFTCLAAAWLAWRGLPLRRPVSR